MRIVFEPVETEGNKYAEIISKGLKRNGLEVFSVTSMFADFNLFSEIKLVHLNWFENLDGADNTAKIITFFKKIFKLFLFWITGKKVVWTMHNRLPHDKELMFFKKLMIKSLIRFSSIIVIHSKMSEEILLELDPSIGHKICYIPHPNYVGDYLPDQPEKITLPADGVGNPVKLLFVGAIKPYKNIELLIELASSFQEEVQLTIAGKPLNAAYQQKLMAAAKGFPNLVMDFAFVTDVALANYIQDTDLLILPYDLRSSLNSGTVILAFSSGKTVICPSIGTIQDLDNQKDVFSYSYANNAEHLIVLKEVLTSVVQLNKDNPGVFKQMGRNMLQEVSGKNSKDRVVTSFLGAYNSLFKV
jgi:beta-1,4-mannosyltransferase